MGMKRNFGNTFRRHFAVMIQAEITFRRLRKETGFTNGFYTALAPASSKLYQG